MDPLPGSAAPAIPERPRAKREEALRARARRVHRSAVVVDSHADTPTRILDEGFELKPRSGSGHVDLPRLRDGGVHAVFFSIFVEGRYAPDRAAHRALQMIDAFQREIVRHPGEIALAGSVAELRRLRRRGVVAAFMGIEGGHALEDDLALLRLYHRLGARYLTLTHMKANGLADASTDAPRWKGLSDLGRAVVREMNRLGMMVDVSHTSDDAAADALEVSRAPVIASHSSCRALCDVPRNLPDDLIRAIGAKGGVVQVCFYPAFLCGDYLRREREGHERLTGSLVALEQELADDPERLHAERRRLILENQVEPPGLGVVVDHVEHAMEIAGPEHVGLGSDFDGISTTPVGLGDCAAFPEITLELLRRGHPEKVVRGVLGGNLLRVLEEVERSAAAG